MYVVAQVAAEIARDGLTDTDGNPAAAVTEQACHHPCVTNQHPMAIDSTTAPPWIGQSSQMQHMLSLW